MAENNEISFLKKAKQVGEQVAQVAAEASRLKDAASRAVEDAVTEAKRLAKRSRYIAEDLVEETAHRIKHDPLRSVAIGFAIGIGVGMLTGWLAARSNREKISPTDRFSSPRERERGEEPSTLRGLTVDLIPSKAFEHPSSNTPCARGSHRYRLTAQLEEAIWCLIRKGN